MSTLSVIGRAKDTYDYVKPTGADNFYHSYSVKRYDSP